MKAIIPVAGAGTKIRPHTYSQPKALMPIANKTILGYIIDQLNDANITEFIFVVGQLGEKIQEYVEQDYPHLTTHFIFQGERQGTGHAIEMAKDWVGDDEVFVVLGDTICEFDMKAIIESPYSMLGVKRVDDPSNFGVASIDDDGFITGVVEKTSIPKSNMALVGLYKIKETAILYECLTHLFEQNIKSHGEFNLTDALQCMIKRGAKFQAFKVKNWFDCGKKETLLEGNTTLLKKFGGHISEDVQTENVVIIPPVSIAKGCVIKNTVIGPNVAIGANTTIQYSIIRDSIIGAHTNLFEVMLNNSLVGNDALVKCLSRSLNVSDNAEIDFG